MSLSPFTRAGFPEPADELEPLTEKILARRTGLTGAIARFRNGWPIPTRLCAPFAISPRVPASTWTFPGARAIFEAIARLARHPPVVFASVFGLQHAEAGRNVVVVTPTASGKTLCYNLPVLNRLIADPARARYIFSRRKRWPKINCRSSRRGRCHAA